MRNGDGHNRTIRIGESEVVRPGETRNMTLKISETSTGRPVHTPIFVANSEEPGPTFFLVAGIHGNELNGVEIVREVINSLEYNRLKGTLICIPVTNVPGFLAGQRNLPNGEDLNRLFPGSDGGSPGERISHKLMEVLSQCDLGFSFHTAVDNWNNMPHIKADVSDNETKRLARAFGTEIIINEPGIDGMLRRTMNDIGKPCVILEAGEPNKFQRSVIDMGVTGVRNLLAEIGLFPGELREPAFRVIVKRTELIRADRGGILDMKVSPRQLVYKNDPLFAVTNPFGKETDIQKAPFTGMVVGVRTRPIVSPGTSVVHVVKLDKTLKKVEEKLRETMLRTARRSAEPELLEPKKRAYEVEVNHGRSPHDEDRDVSTDEPEVYY